MSGIVKKGCSNRRAASSDKCLIYSGYLSAYYGACTFTPNGNVRHHHVHMRTRGLLTPARIPVSTPIPKIYIITNVRNKVNTPKKTNVKTKHVQREKLF